MKPVVFPSSKILEKMKERHIMKAILKGKVLKRIGIDEDDEDCIVLTTSDNDSFMIYNDDKPKNIDLNLYIQEENEFNKILNSPITDVSIFITYEEIIEENEPAENNIVKVRFYNIKIDTKTSDYTFKWVISEDGEPCNGNNIIMGIV